MSLAVVVVAAIGQPRFVRGEWLNVGAVVADVSSNSTSPQNPNWQGIDSGPCLNTPRRSGTGHRSASASTKSRATCLGSYLTQVWSVQRQNIRVAVEQVVRVKLGLDLAQPRKVFAPQLLGRRDTRCCPDCCPCEPRSLAQSNTRGRFVHPCAKVEDTTSS